MRKFVVKIRKTMAEHVQDIADGIRSKVKVIIDRQNMLTQQVATERAKVESLHKTVDALQKEVSRLKADNEYLTVMRAVAVTPQQAEQSRALLAGLVREIDRCIAELKAC